MEQGPDFWCWFDTTQFSYHCVHPIHAKMFSIQMLLYFSQIVPRVCTLVLFIIVEKKNVKTSSSYIKHTYIYIHTHTCAHTHAHTHTHTHTHPMLHRGPKHPMGGNTVIGVRSAAEQLQPTATVAATQDLWRPGGCRGHHGRL